MTKYFWRFFLTTLFFFSLMFVLFDYGPVVRVPILQYERLQSGGVTGSGWVSPRDFVNHILYITNNKINVIPLKKIVKLYKKKKKLPSRTIALTFDGSHDYLMDVVFNKLVKNKLPATFFITTDLIGEEGYLSEEDLNTLRESGLITIASNGIKENIDLTSITVQDAYSQAYFSKTTLKSFVGVEIDYFSYPKGKFTPQVVNKIKEAGYKAAFASYLGSTKFKREKGVFWIERTPIKDVDKRLLHLRFKCWGNYTILSAWFDKYIGKYF